MKSFTRVVLLSAGSLFVAGSHDLTAQIQSTAVDNSIASAAMPEATASPSLSVHSEKPTLMVMGFESGTVTAQVRDKRGLAAILAGMRGGTGDENYDPSQLGVGIADMLVGKLFETGAFRLLERKPAQPGNGAQFIVNGSVTKFGFEEHNFGGVAATVATMGLLNYKQHKTEVTLTARVINAATGEIVASVTGEGISTKGGGLRVVGIGANGGGGADVNTVNFRATAIGEATERAVSDLAAKLVQRRGAF
jgi:curli biogenesis system outer membrane secretion channel CsgG